jgi:uncharacterized protein (TIGR02270 family)
VTVVYDIVSQHAQEASTLWLLRNSVINSPDAGLLELNRLDQRIEAHLDGLHVAGEKAWPICEERLGSGDAGDFFTATVQALVLNNPALLGKVLDLLRERPQFSTGVISALGWLPLQTIQSQSDALFSSPIPRLQRIGLAGSAVHRRIVLRMLQDACGADDLPLRARGWRAVGELGATILLDRLGANLQAQDPEVRFWAAWSSVLRSSGTPALNILKASAESGGGQKHAAIQVLTRRMELPAAKAWHKPLTVGPECSRSALQAAGLIGDPELIPWLFPHMKVPPLARVAGEAFTMITGVDLAYHDLEGEWPEGFEAGPNEDPKDENVDMDPDENLPWPNPELVQKWWEKNKGHFQNGVRYLCGKPMTIDWLKIVLRDGFQRQRAAAALELAIRQPGTPLFNVKAPGFRQIELLGKPKGPIRSPDHAG